MPKYNTKKRYLKPKPKKFYTELCNDDMTFKECEIAIIRHAAEESENTRGKKVADSEEIRKMIIIVEDFIIHKKLVCYGGTAINNILPKAAQFYNHELEIPDYDFYSANALDDAKELADIYYASGYKDVEAKAGVHMGTFKVFVNFIPIADITFIHKDLYDAISKESVLIAGIHYAPPDYLRMSMYLELSRPAGDVSRWEKVLTRLTLLNEHFPMKIGRNCEKIEFHKKVTKQMDQKEKLHVIARDCFIDQGTVFFGAYAMGLYSNYMNSEQKDYVNRLSQFDIISENPEKCALILKETLERENFKKIKTVVHPEIGETIPEHVEVSVGDETIAFIYKPIACHNYNKIVRGNKEINIASIDTILTFYLCFLYAKTPYYNKDRLSCMARFLFEIQQKNRIEQRGILKRFSLECYGKQPTLEDMRAEKAEKYKELSKTRSGKEYDMWFLKYTPDKNAQKTEITKSVSKKLEEYKIETEGSTKQEENEKEESVKTVKTAKTAADASVETEEVNKYIEKNITKLKNKSRKTQKKHVSFMDRFRLRRNKTNKN